jgi:chaperone required for assembly of F1-ATPase
MSEMSDAPRDPVRAQANMRPQPVRRIYKAVEVREADGRHALMLDDHRALTPGRNPLAAHSRALMLRVAAEWERQHETIDPAKMPLTRLLNSAIDGVAHTMAETRADILGYAGSDLLCYRAEEPDTLVARQAHAFDPVLRWAAESLGARLNVTTGVMHVAQPPEALAAIAAALDTYDDPVALAALSVMSTLT